ncbi:hypothetical protein AB4Y85_18340 [Microvirga sp. 2YAF29]|uniref:hypothetical protein n=1 Tax=Microvirga sp. 2YAF29 TaxID=3233031 RepID=UPI003F9E9862
MHRHLAISSLIATSALIGNAALAQQQFDGRWSIHAVPEKGGCRRGHNYTVVVENGIPRNAAAQGNRDKAIGGLGRDGGVRISVQRRRAHVAITGKLSERSGFGAWTVTGSIACSGRWAASKWG